MVKNTTDSSCVSVHTWFFFFRWMANPKPSYVLFYIAKNAFGLFDIPELSYALDIPKCSYVTTVIPDFDLFNSILP